MKSRYQLYERFIAIFRNMAGTGSPSKGTISSATAGPALKTLFEVPKSESVEFATRLKYCTRASGEIVQYVLPIEKLVPILSGSYTGWSSNVPDHDFVLPSKSPFALPRVRT